jgi:hypothetical protein
MNSENGRGQSRGRTARVTRRRRPGFTQGSRRCGAAVFAASFGRKPYGAATAAHGTPGDRPPAVPAVSRCRAHPHHGQTVTLVPDAPIAMRCHRNRGRSAAHCPGWPLRPQRCFASRCAGRTCGAPLTPETSASPAGLTARARPEARPFWRAANLRRSIRHLPAERRREPGTGCRSRARLACCTAPCHAGCDATLRLGSWPG